MQEANTMRTRIPVLWGFACKETTIALSGEGRKAWGYVSLLQQALVPLFILLWPYPTLAKLQLRTCSLFTLRPFQERSWEAFAILTLAGEGQ